MCGVGGCVLKGDTVPSPERLARLRDAMAHRGPDTRGIHLDGNVALVSTRLAIMDTGEAGYQPMRDPTGWVLSYNGAIMNHHDIRKHLTRVEFRSSSDTETLLRALVETGPTAVGQLNGQFAFAAFDPVHKRLLLTRDRFGIKPLYVARTPDGVWFASEPRALLAAGVSATWADDGWTQTLQGSYYSGRATLLKGVHRVPPGVWVVIDVRTGEVHHERWANTEELVLRSRRDARVFTRHQLADQLEDVLTGAVNRALLADVNVGSLCSGGVDSSLITAIAARSNHGLVSFAAHYRADKALDEGPAAQRAADAIGVDLDLMEVTEEGWRRGFVEATVHFGAPIANASAVVVSAMAERARSRGVKVLLTGEGADELFAGYRGLHHELLDSFQPRWVRMTAMVERLINPGVGPAAAIEQGIRMLTAYRRNQPGWSSLTNPDGDEAKRASRVAYAHHPGPRGRLESALLATMGYTLGHLLNRMDANVMQHSVEARVPYLDNDVVRLVLNLPLEARVGPWSKGILRDVARRLLPWTIAHRPKVYGMSFDADRWIQVAARKQFLFDGMLVEQAGLSGRQLNDCLAEADRATRIRVWSAEVWCRAYLAGQPTAAIEADIWV